MGTHARAVAKGSAGVNVAVGLAMEHVRVQVGKQQQIIIPVRRLNPHTLNQVIAVVVIVQVAARIVAMQVVDNLVTKNAQVAVEEIVKVLVKEDVGSHVREIVEKHVKVIVQAVV